MAKIDQTRPATQLQHLLKQPGQRFEMALAKIADRAEVRPVHCRHRLKVEPFLATPRNLAGGVDAAAIGIAAPWNRTPER
jgi:hypothetical protein